MESENTPPIGKKTTPPPLPPSQKAPSEADTVSSGKATYNIVSDTLIGVNVRGSDNKFQALFVLAAIVIFAIIGVIVVLCNPSWDSSWSAGAIAGAVAGLLIGFFASGIYLMIYRGVRHIRGKHD